MPTLNDMYREFGDAWEAPQLPKTELGNILMAYGAFEGDLK
jgi:hypothetical protein